MASAYTGVSKKKEGGNSDNPRVSSASLPFRGAAVVVGGGVAGTAAAAELCSCRPDARVTLVARDDKVKVSFVLFCFLVWRSRGRRGKDKKKKKKGEG
jgi:hypothetical protein